MSLLCELLANGGHENIVEMTDNADANYTCACLWYRSLRAPLLNSFIIIVWRVTRWMSNSQCHRRQREMTKQKNDGERLLLSSDERLEMHLWHVEINKFTFEWTASCAPIDTFPIERNRARPSVNLLFRSP